MMAEASFYRMAPNLASRAGAGEQRAGLCQTNPISRFSALKTTIVHANKANLGSRAVGPGPCEPSAACQAEKSPIAEPVVGAATRTPGRLNKQEAKDQAASNEPNFELFCAENADRAKRQSGSSPGVRDKRRPFRMGPNEKGGKMEKSERRPAGSALMVTR